MTVGIFEDMHINCLDSLSISFNTRNQSSIIDCYVLKVLRHISIVHSKLDIIKNTILIINAEQTQVRLCPLGCRLIKPSGYQAMNLSSQLLGTTLISAAFESLVAASRGVEIERLRV